MGTGASALDDVSRESDAELIAQARQLHQRDPERFARIVTAATVGRPQASVRCGLK
jgi:hypothetical protein